MSSKLSITIPTLAVAILATVATTPASAASPAAIGIVTASGHFTVEGSEVFGNSTLFEGARIQTGKASSQLALSNGVKVQLGAGSTASVYKNRLVLEQGISQVSAPGSFEVSALGWKVAADGGRFRVGIGEEVLVASLSGTARVSGIRGGGTLATLPAGRNMSFALLQAVSYTGCLLYKDNGYILSADDSPEVVELQGPDLATNVGNRVQIGGNLVTGPARIAPATSVVSVTSVSPVSQGGCLTQATAINAQTSAPQAAIPAQSGGATPSAAKPIPSTQGTGMSTGAKAGIAIAVIGGGVGGALAAAGGKSSTSQ